MNATIVLSRIAAGESAAIDEFLPLVYTELRKLAHGQLKHERAGHTLDTTALVHEVYLRLFGPEQAVMSWSDLGHFFAIASREMRRVLVEHARSRGRIKRGKGRRRLPTTLLNGVEQRDDSFAADDILALDEALTRLGAIDPTALEVIELRYFAGLSVQDAASALGISQRSVSRYWTFGRAWLHRDLYGH